VPRWSFISLLTDIGVNKPDFSSVVSWVG